MAVLSKKQMSEEDIKLNFIIPAIQPNWQGHITMETKITAVSYTHLDVYKRQIQYRSVYHWGQFENVLLSWIEGMGQRKRLSDRYLSDSTG